jgi:hypothetical protein
VGAVRVRERDVRDQRSEENLTDAISLGHRVKELLVAWAMPLLAAIVAGVCAWALWPARVKR